MRPNQAESPRLTEEQEGQRKITIQELFDKVIPNNQKLAERGMLATSFVEVLQAVKAGEVTPVLKDETEILNELYYLTNEKWQAEKDPITKDFLEIIADHLADRDLSIAREVTGVSLNHILCSLYCNYSHYPIEIEKPKDFDEKFLEIKNRVGQMILDMTVLLQEDINLTQVEIGEE